MEYAPADWSRGISVRISSIKLRFNGDTPSYHGLLRMAQDPTVGDKRHSFFVHPDELDLAPKLTVAAELVGRSPSKALADAKARGEKDVGDPVAVMLRDAKSLDDVYKIGAKYLNLKEADLRAKYGHLNPGQQRMNVGNKMRAAWRKTQR